MFFEHFRRQLGDGGVSIPPGPSLEVHFGRRYSDRFQLEARVEAEVGWGRRAREAQGKGG